MNGANKREVAGTIKSLLTVSFYLVMFLLVILTLATGYIVLFNNEVLMETEETNLIVQSMGLEVEFETEIVKPIETLSFLFTVVSLAPLLILGAFAIFNLKKIFDHLVNDSFFSIENSELIKKTGIFTILISIIQTIAQTYFARSLVDAINTTNVQIRTQIEFDMTVIFLGVILIVLAESFKLGVQVKEEKLIS